MTRLAAMDSNVLIALMDRQDKWHSQAKLLWNALKDQNFSLIYLDCVLNETISVLARRAHEQNRSAEFVSLLDELLHQIPERLITWVSGDIPRLFRDIVEIVRQSGGALNFHDALIALSCLELGVRIIVSLDEDFDRISWLRRIASVADIQRSLSV
jgi:Predicted nucleic acid-binding protein, contains PIN domain